ncbi:MAG: acylphosphatase [Balneolaceae bacterium]
MKSEVEKHLIIKGRVQGVGFRYFTKKNAESLGVQGWVKNLSNGDVETVIQGEEDQVKEMINYLKSGPVSAKVEEVREVDESEKLHQSYDNFSIIG